jgi:hypothetical protein
VNRPKIVDTQLESDMESIWDSREKQSREEQTNHQFAPGITRSEMEATGSEMASVRDRFLERAPDEDGKIQGRG